MCVAANADTKNLNNILIEVSYHCLLCDIETYKAKFDMFIGRLF